MTLPTPPDTTPAHTTPDDAAPARTAPAPGAVLKLLSGRLAGRSVPLDGRTRVSIGHGLRHDVVLRGEGADGCSALLELDRPQPSLIVLEGRIEILGRSLGAGERVQLPAYLPFRIGGHALAHGMPGAARWAEAEADGLAGPPAPRADPPPIRLSDRLLDAASRQIDRIDRQTMRLMLTIACIALVTVAAAGPVGSLIAARSTEPARLRHALNRAGFPAVDVGRAPDGTLAVTGVVADEPDLTRLRALVQAEDADAIVDAQTGAALADAAADLLRARGIAARVRPGRPGTLLIEAGFLPADRREQVSASLRAELPSVRRIGFRTDPALDSGPLQAFFARSGAGLATIVSNPPHIVTADGSRWFPGATLPSGHHLLAVGPGAIVFEKGGRTEQIIP